MKKKNDGPTIKVRDRKTGKRDAKKEGVIKRNNSLSAGMEAATDKVSLEEAKAWVGFDKDADRTYTTPTSMEIH